MALIDIPFPTQTLGQTNLTVRNNFLYINAGFAVNHVTLNGPNAGKHNLVQMIRQGADPAVAATEISTYNKLGVSGVSEVFLRRGSPAKVYDTTGSILSTNPTIAGANSGWTYLPSGILLKWGLVGAGGLNPEITFPAAGTIPVFAAQPFCVFITPSLQATFNVQTIAVAKFKVLLSVNTGFAYLAIGR